MSKIIDIIILVILLFIGAITIAYMFVFGNVAHDAAYYVIVVYFIVIFVLGVIICINKIFNKKEKPGETE